MANLYTNLSLGAQSSYAELYDMAQSVAVAKFATIRGSFHRRLIRNKTYIYFNFRDADGRVRSAYVGPDGARVQRLVDEFENADIAGRRKALSQRAGACMALGCSGIVDKHFRLIHKLASYGFFRAGGVLIGTHAFAAMGTMLGVRWTRNDKVLDVDFADASRNILIALPADLEISVPDAITSLEMGLLPIREFSGRTAAQYSNPQDPELRIDFLTPEGGRCEAFEMSGLRIELGPQKFMEFALEGTAQGVVFGKSGACVVNIPDPARYVVHQLMGYTEKPIAKRLKSLSDLEQAAALIEWHVEQDRVEHLRQAWQNALNRGPDWRRRFDKGAAALSKRHPPLTAVFR